MNTPTRKIEFPFLCVLAALREILIVVINDLILPEAQIILPEARFILPKARRASPKL